MSKIYKRKCKYCNKDVTFPNKKELSKAEELNKKCRNCKRLDFLSFDDARRIVRNLNIPNQDYWQDWIKSEEGKKYMIPSNPDIFYKNTGWISYSDWLGNNNYRNIRKIQYLTYTNCKKYILENHPEITNKSKWISFDKSILPLNIPKRPDVLYKGTGWVNWESFLDSPLSPRSKSSLFMNFEDAKKYVRGFNIKSESEYYHHIEENNIKFLPLRPDNRYKNQWNGFIDFLGINSLRRSTGEDRIKDILDRHGISYEREKKFSGCKSKKELPFDFYIKSLNLCIEYDGELHSKPVKHFGGQSVFERIKKNDEIKNKWCQDNGINLIRISHLDKWRISKILEPILNLDLYGREC